MQRYFVRLTPITKIVARGYYWAYEADRDEWRMIAVRDDTFTYDDRGGDLSMYQEFIGPLPNPKSGLLGHYES